MNGPTTGKTTLEGLRLLGVLPGGQQPPKGPRPKPLATSREIAKQSAFEGMAKPRRLIGDRREPEMNGWEKEYAARLDLLRAAGEVVEWHFGHVRLHLADGSWYKPDFLVVYRDRAEFHEIKGYRRPAGIQRFKSARDRYSWIRFRMITKKNGEWEEI